MAYKKCETCTYFKDNKCTKEYKPRECPIRTYRGRYNKLEDSNIIVKTEFGNYRFPSIATKEKFEKMLEYRLKQLRICRGVIFKYTDIATKTFDLSQLVMLCYEKTYKESLIYGNNIYTQTKR